ncbi:ABC transporter permease [Desulfovibrio sp. OttesenSCG-928-O18]|nr:ABC transporter permease [Desulfovibrio sp. OttesenSCG-928-O18]
MIGFLGNFRIVKRDAPLGKFYSLGLLCLSFVIALGVSALLLEVQGKPGLHGIALLLQGGFGTPLEFMTEARAEGAGFITALFRGFFWDNYALADTFLKSIPIFLCSLGVAVCFYLQVWNIGAEGQFALGAIGGTAVVLWFPNLPSFVMLPLMFLAASLAGALWAAIPAILRERLRTNEIISTLMLNYLAIILLQYLVFGPWKDPGGMGFPMTSEFPPAAVMPEIFGRVHGGILLCIGAAIALNIFLNRTRYGYEILVGGANPQAAHYAGMRYSAMVIGVMCLCGALAAWAGCLETSATLGRLRPNVVVGYGYTAIVVAWLARLRVLRIAAFSLVLAALRVGVEILQLDLGISAAFGDMIQGLILLCMLAGQFPESYRIKRTVREEPEPDRALSTTGGEAC